MNCVNACKKECFFEDQARFMMLDTIPHHSWAEAFIDVMDNTSSLACYGDELLEYADFETEAVELEFQALKIPMVVNTFLLDEFYQNKYADDRFCHKKLKITMPDGIVFDEELFDKKIYHIGSQYLNPVINSFAIPKDLGLIYLAAKYKAKYDASIFVAGSLDSIKIIFDEVVDDKKISLFGIICADKRYDICHVTPLLILKKEDASLQIANLDSVKAPINYLAHALCFLKTKKIAYQRFSLKGARQADRYSCRTDALVILKDAIQELAEKKITDLSWFFSGQMIHERRIYVDLPASWAKGCQRSSMITKQALDQSFFNTKYTLSEFRKKFDYSCERKDVYEIGGIDDKGCYQIIVKEHTKKTQVNLYLNFKGKRNFESLKAFIGSMQIKDRDWISKLERLYG